MNKPRILVLEDDAKMLSMLSGVLEDEGFEVVSASNGLEAVEAASKSDFDLIISDIRMDGISGLEAVERSRQYQPELGAIFISGFADPENTEKAHQLQAGRILSKPFKLVDFLDRVQGELKTLQTTRARMERKRGYQNGLLWALETLSSVLGTPEVRPSPQALADLGEKLVLAAGLSEDVAREVGLACVLAAHEETVVVPEEFLRDQTALTTLKYCLSNWKDQRARIEARIVGLVVVAIPEDQPPDSPLPSPTELAQSGCDPELIKLYLSVTAEQGVGQSLRSDSSQRGLLALAQVLSKFDPQSAKKAYQQIIESSAGRELIESLLGLSRLHLGDSELLKPLTEQAVQEAHKLGPVAHASTLLRAGLLEFRANLDSSSRLLEAVGELSKLGFDGSVALGALALVALGHRPNQKRLPRYLEALCQPRYFEEVAAEAEWLIPVCWKLLGPEQDESTSKTVVRLMTRIPNSQARVEEVPKEAKLAFLKRMRQLNSGGVTSDLVRCLSEDGDPEVAQRASSLSQETGEEPEVLLRCRSFGHFQASVGSEQLPDKEWGSKKVRYYFARLASRWGRFVTEDSLMETFWPEKSADKAKKNLYWSTSAIRRALGRKAPALKEVLERREETLRLKPDAPFWHDVQEFENSIEQAKAELAAGKTKQGRNLLLRAAELYTGPYLEGCYDDWVLQRREELAQLAMESLCLLAEVSSQLQEPRSALEAAQRALSLDRFSQQAHQQAMAAYLALGEAQATVEQYLLCKDVLLEEFGLDPSAEIEQLYEQALMAQ